MLLDGEPTCEIDIAASQPTLLATLYASLCPERSAYLDSVSSPMFYEGLGTGKNWTRDECKTEFFNQIAFGSYWCAHKYELLPAFTARFPILAARMAEIKKRGNSVLPLKMQAIEASIVIGGVCAECSRFGIKVLPVHDSIICKANEVSTVEEIFTRHWREKTGLPAQFKKSAALIQEVA